VVFGISNLAVKVLTINRLDHVLPFLALAALKLVKTITVAEHQHQIGLLPQGGAAAKGINQRGNVLAAIRPGEGQQTGTIGMPQKRLHQR
tara:strand:- start:5216 stop:5485 length:270 start_codon:yes stop_codon:yes gene_type:complete